MRIIRIGSWRAPLVASILVALTAVDTAAQIVVGGGSPRTDCLGVFTAPANSPAGRPRNIRCVDGEACDADGTVNGVCRFAVGFCANSTQLSACSLQGVEEILVEHAADDGIDPDFDPQLQALQTQIDSAIDLPATDADLCSAPITFRLPVKGPLGNNRCSAGRARIAVTTVSTFQQGRAFRDRDVLRLTCYPSRTLNGCDPQTFFASTFDRVQEQILTPTCAVAVCHDSQTVAANLLLEAGASRANLVGVVPSNGAASAAGWRRIDSLGPASAALETSFLYRKVTGDLPSDSFGLRMPRKRPRLHKTSLDVLRIWIESGAQDESAGWLPGTF